MPEIDDAIEMDFNDIERHTVEMIYYGVTCPMCKSVTYNEEANVLYELDDEFECPECGTLFININDNI